MDELPIYRRLLKDPYNFRVSMNQSEKVDNLPNTNQISIRYICERDDPHVYTRNLFRKTQSSIASKDVTYSAYIPWRKAVGEVPKVQEFDSMSRVNENRTSVSQSESSSKLLEYTTHTLYVTFSATGQSRPFIDWSRRRERNTHIYAFRCLMRWRLHNLVGRVYTVRPTEFGCETLSNCLYCTCYARGEWNMLIVSAYVVHLRCTRFEI